MSSPFWHVYLLVNLTKNERLYFICLEFVHSKSGNTNFFKINNLSFYAVNILIYILWFSMFDEPFLAAITYMFWSIRFDFQYNEYFMAVLWQFYRMYIYIFCEGYFWEGLEKSWDNWNKILKTLAEPHETWIKLSNFSDFS